MTPLSTVVTDPPDLINVTSHWWWRPGWQVGRRFYACHLALGTEAGLVELADRVQSRLGQVPELDLVPRRWLHLTLQGIGFTDEIPREELQRITAAVQNRLALLAPLRITFDHLAIYTEAITLPVTTHTRAAVTGLRAAVRAGIADTRADGPEQQSAGHYRPHISLAYANATTPASRIQDAVDEVAVPPVTVTIDAVPLIELHRDNKIYEWRQLAQLPVGERPEY